MHWVFRRALAYPPGGDLISPPLETRNFAVGYSGHALLRQMSMDMAAATTLGVSLDNGSGKSKSA